MEKKEKALAEFEEVAARGYLGGMDMPKHATEVRQIYSEKRSKIKHKDTAKGAARTNKKE